MKYKAKIRKQSIDVIHSLCTEVKRKSSIAAHEMIFLNAVLYVQWESKKFSNQYS